MCQRYDHALSACAERLNGLGRVTVASEFRLYPGIPRDKVCIIDRELVLHGLYDLVARPAMRLPDAESGHAHLYTLNRRQLTTPALVLGRRLGVLASNQMARALLTDFDALPHRERNLVRFMFCDGTARSLYTHWDTHAQDIVASLQPSLVRHRTVDFEDVVEGVDGAQTLPVGAGVAICEVRVPPVGMGNPCRTFVRAFRRSGNLMSSDLG
jgi:hypothetical protein